MENEKKTISKIALNFGLINGGINVVFGLIFMNSEKLQRKYFERRNAKREVAEQQRIDKEKAEKRAARKSKKS